MGDKQVELADLEMTDEQLAAVFGGMEFDTDQEPTEPCTDEPPMAESVIM